ncbi:MAG: (2Fe-2S)-binding protein [Anaerolineae bacterium]|nr:(2Fe-2S)-binding protein [Anaerolineae bacterium]MDW8173284.1 2Fe-2S iron-sulfur cluster-binding protein [Anaerolineae bacterium]
MPRVTILEGQNAQTIEVQQGANLRRALLNAGYSPYAALTRRLNCGGRGLCATCGVWIVKSEPQPQHWHDRLASAFGYPRLSCQINVNSDMTIRLVEDKIIWGSRDSQRARRWS